MNKTDAASEDLLVPVTLKKEVKKRRASAPLFKGVATLVSMVPTYRETRSGRASARHLKIVLGLIGGVLVLASSEFLPLIVLGLLIAALAAIVPIGELRKRSILSALKQRSVYTETKERPGSLLHDGRRLILHDGDERVRRVLTNRAFRLEERRTEEGGRCLVAAPQESRKKRDAIVMLFEGERALPDALPMTSEQMDEPAWVDSERAEALSSMLMHIHTSHVES